MYHHRTPGAGHYGAKAARGKSYILEFCVRRVLRVNVTDDNGSPQGMASTRLMLSLLALPCLDSLLAPMPMPALERMMLRAQVGGHGPTQLRGSVGRLAQGVRGLTLTADGRHLATRVLSSSLLAAGAIRLVHPAVAGAFAPVQRDDTAMVQRISSGSPGNLHRWALAFADDEEAKELDDLADDETEGSQDLQAKLAFTDEQVVLKNVLELTDRSACSCNAVLRRDTQEDIA
jgi:hypothetical protein